MRATAVKASLIAAPAILALAACGQPQTAEAPADAAAPAPAVRAATGATASAALLDGQGRQAGTVSFRQGPLGLLIRVEATGLTPGWHGFHLHKVGQCEGPGFTSAGGHVSHGEQALPHGLLNPEGDDAGDLPNVHADAQGRVFAEVFTTTARLADSGPGEHLLDADGSAIMIHANADDHLTQPIGGSGDRVVCGVIEAG